jgi:type IV secretion system protein VirD4
VLVLPEGQYPIRTKHIRYYEDKHFAPIDRARKGNAPAAPVAAVTKVAGTKAATLSSFALPTIEASAAERGIPKATEEFTKIAQKARRQREMPGRQAEGQAELRL